MKNIKQYYGLVLILVAIVLSPLVNLHAVNPKSLSKKEQKWFDEQIWLQGVASIPDTGIDVVAFSRHYAKFPERWDKMFKFIKK